MKKNSNTTCVKTILNTEYPPLQFTINKILPQGLFILAGSPKIGKSWLILDICTTVSSGSEIWDYRTEQNGVLYYALEDTHRRIQSRIIKMGADKKDMKNFNIKLSAPCLSKGLVEQIDHHMQEYPDTALVVIDTFEHIRNKDIVKQTLYSTDYNDIKQLRTITDKYPVTLLLVHHTRKMQDDDPLNLISGSTGISGATDGNWILEKIKRTENNAKLTISNRDTEGFCFDLKFNTNNCRWEFMGNHSSQSDKDEELAFVIDDFLSIIHNADSDVNQWIGTPTELCNELNKLAPYLDLNNRTLSKKFKNITHLLEEFEIHYELKRTRKSSEITLKRGNSR